MALGTILLTLSILMLVLGEWVRRRSARKRGLDDTSAGGLI